MREPTASPYFSVAIPAFKGRFLSECIESVLAQSDGDFELIIVDDASPENLKAIVEKFADPRIRFHRNERGFGGENLTGNWNRCLELTRGKFMLCMGDDDRLLPECLAEFRKLIARRPGLGVYHTLVQTIDERGEIAASAEPRPEYETAYSELWYVLTGYRLQYIGDFLFCVERLRKLGGFYPLPYAWGSDKITVLAAAQESGLATTPAHGYQYRQSAITISSSAALAEPKIAAMQKARVWLRNFLAECPGDSEARPDADRSAAVLDDYIKRHIWWLIHSEIRAKPRRLIHWLGNFRKAGLTLRDIVKFVRYRRSEGSKRGKEYGKAFNATSASPARNSEPQTSTLPHR